MDLSDSESEETANKLYKTLTGMMWELIDFSSEICSFKREFKDELTSQSSALDVL